MELTQSPLSALLARTTNLRNVALVGAADHGCTTLLNALQHESELRLTPADSAAADETTDDSSSSSSSSSTSWSPSSSSPMAATRPSSTVGNSAFLPTMLYHRLSVVMSALAALSETERAALQALAAASAQRESFLCPRARVGGVAMCSDDVLNVVRSFLSCGRLLYGLPADGGTSGEHVINVVQVRSGIAESELEAVKLADGALIVTDSVEGVTVGGERLVRLLMTERVRPVVFLNKVS